MSDNINKITNTSQSSTTISPTTQIPNIENQLKSKVNNIITDISIPDRTQLVNNFKQQIGDISSAAIDKIANNYAQTIIDIATAAQNSDTPNKDIIYGLGLAIMKAMEFYITSLLQMQIVDPAVYAQNILNSLAGQEKAKSVIATQLASTKIPNNSQFTIPTSNLTDPPSVVGGGFGAGGRGGF